MNFINIEPPVLDVHFSPAIQDIFKRIKKEVPFSTLEIVFTLGFLFA